MHLDADGVAVGVGRQADGASDGIVAQVGGAQT